MGNIGRFFCVALPFILTAAGIITMLVVGLVGVTDNKNLYMFRVNATDLRLNQSAVETLVGGLPPRSTVLDTRDIGDDIASAADKLQGAADQIQGTATSGADSAIDKLKGSVTSDLPAAASSILASSGVDVNADGSFTPTQFAYVYDVNLWGYCQTSQNGTRTCTKGEFNWAEKTFNTTSVNASSLTNVAATAGVPSSSTNYTLPDSIQDSLTAFKAVAKWTEVVYIIAMIALGLELFVGLFTYCSRIVSCITYLVSGIATTAVIAFAIMVSVMSSLVVGAVKASAKVYGADASTNNSYLAGVWIAAAFTLGASLFWLFSACCCKRDHSSRRRGGKHDDEKPFLPTGAYAPLGNGGHSRNSSHGYAQQAYGAPRGGNARSDLAYEPYSHSNV